MALLETIMKSICDESDVLFYAGTAREVTEKIALTGKTGKTKYPAVLLFTDALEFEDNGFYQDYSLMFLIVDASNPREYGKTTDFDKQYEIKDDLFLEMARDKRVTGIRINREHNAQQKYLINGTDKLAVLEVTIENFLIKKTCK